MGADIPRIWGQRLSVVFSHEEAMQVIGAMSGARQCVASLMNSFQARYRPYCSA